MGALPEWTFLSYRAKSPWMPPADQNWFPIELVCDVGENLCEPPKGWMERWDFNRAGCYATPEAAWATVVEEHKAFRLFAYELLPVQWDDTGQIHVVKDRLIFATDFDPLPDRPSELPRMTQIGYDVVEKQSDQAGFAYSPLVTNGFARSFGTNRYGLIEDLDLALRADRVINREMPEHSPHWVVRVFWDADHGADLSPLS